MQYVHWKYLSKSVQVAQATRHGAIGIIIYSDPADYSDNQTENVYPESMWLPPSGAQRGTVIKTDGDPLTPGYPATGTVNLFGRKPFATFWNRFKNTI